MLIITVSTLVLIGIFFPLIGMMLRPVKFYRYGKKDLDGRLCKYAYVKCHNPWQLRAVRRKIPANPGLYEAANGYGPKCVGAQFILYPKRYERNRQDTMSIRLWRLPYRMTSWDIKNFIADFYSNCDTDAMVFSTVSARKIRQLYAEFPDNLAGFLSRLEFTLLTITEE